MSSRSGRFDFRGFAITAIGLFLARLIVGPPQAIDLEHQYGQWIGVLLNFAIWIFFLCTWGSFFSGRIHRSDTGSTEALFSGLLWGSVFSAYGMSVLNLAEATVLGGVLSSGVGRVLLLIVFCGGACWLRFSGSTKPLFRPLAARVRSLTLAERWCIGIVALGFLTRFLFAARLHPHGDALLYHLLGPRSLFDRGDFVGFIENPILFQVSHWESLFQWPNLLFANGPGTGLAWVQVFAQWIHTFLGWGGAGLGVYVLLRRASVSVVGSLAVSAAALSVAQLEWTSHLAKSDWGLVFWSTGLVWLWTQKRYVASGFLAGIIFSAKVTSAFALIPLAAVALILGLYPRRPKEITGLVLAGVLGCAPIWIRNAWIAGNPFFPTLNEFFQSPLLAESFRLGVNKHSFFHVQMDFATWAARLKELLTQTYWSSVLLLAPLAYGALLWRDRLGTNTRQRARVLFSLLVFTWSSWALFTAKVSSDAEMRWLGPALPLALAANGALLVQSAVVLWPRLKAVAAGGTLAPLFLFLIVVTSGIPNFAWVQWGPKKVPLPDQAVMRMRNGPAKKWLREHGGDALTLTTQDNELYYVSEKRVWVSYFNPAADHIARETSETRDVERAVALWKQLGVRYYLFDSGPLPPASGDSQSLDALLARWIQGNPVRVVLGTVERPQIIDFGQSSP